MKYLKIKSQSFLLVICLLLFSQSREALGDVNNDGTINIQDIIRIVNIILENGLPPTDYELWASDVNNDEQVNVTDIIIIVNYIFGIGILCPEGYSFCPDSISECCADVTSHEFVWEITNLGLPGWFSMLLDAAVVNDTNIWVVGDIKESDQTYNAAHWNGTEWERVQILLQAELKAIHYFDENNIWVSPGTPIHWNGSEWVLYHLYDMGIMGDGDGLLKHIWGPDPNCVFFIGDLGAIIHYDGSTFLNMEVPTEVDLKSISGTGYDNVWVCGENLEIGENITVLLHFDGFNWEIVYEGAPIHNPEPDFLSGTFRGVYTDHPDTVWVVTDNGIYRCPTSTNGEGELFLGGLHWQSQVYTVSGNTHNDLFIGCAWTNRWHYNGIDVYEYDNIPSTGPLWGSSINEDVVIFVGYDASNSSALIIKGNRN